MKLHNKVVLITGASGGIGDAIARKLYSKGMKITLTGRRKDKLDALAKDIDPERINTFVFPVDLKDEGAIRLLFKKSQEKWGKLDVLINNAAEGIDAPLLTGLVKEWKKMLDINVLAIAITMQTAMDYFDAKQGGHIINLSSTSAHRIPLQGKFYTATKFAARILTEVMQQELDEAGNPTKISSISPGRVATNMFKDPDASLPLNKNLTELNPDDVAQAILYQLECPQHVTIKDIMLCANKQKYNL